MSNLLQSGCSLLTQNSQYLLLFALSLLYILLYKKGIINRLGILLTTLLLLIYCPLTAAIIGKYQTNFYDRGNMGVMLPLIPLIGYAVTGIFYIFIDKYLSGKNKLWHFLPLGLLVFILVFTGGLRLMPYEKAQLGNTSDSYKVIDNTLSLIPSDSDNQPVIIGKDEIIARARINDRHSFRLPYGRNMFESQLNGYTYDSYSTELQKLHLWYNDIYTNYTNAENIEMLTYMKSLGIKYCIFDNYRLLVGSLIDSIDCSNIYSFYDENDEYSIFMLQDSSNTPAQSEWIITSYSDDSGNQGMFYSIENTANNSLILIDGGWHENTEKVRSVIASHDNHVNAWFVTHYHNDHVDAVNDILANPDGITIDTIYAPLVDVEYYSKVANEWDSVDSLLTFEALKDNYNIEYPKRDSSLTIEGLKFEIFNTYDEALLNTGSNDIPNDLSLMFKITGNNDSMLFCGDCHSLELSNLLINTYTNCLSANIVQAGHHGNNSLPTDFYDIVNPSVVIYDAPAIQTESNTYSYMALKHYLNKKDVCVFDYRNKRNTVSID